MTIKSENNDQNEQTTIQSSKDILKNISPEDFLGLGIHDIAYIRKIEANGKQHYTIHAADGTPLSVKNDRNTALGTLIKNQLEIVTLH